MTYTGLLILLSAATFLSVVSGVLAAVSLWIHYRTGSVASLESLAKQTSLDLHELFDTVEKWTRRDRVRRLRESREEPAEAAQPQAELSLADRKALLRRKAQANGIGG